jgi:Mg/Co/Ni transporter MgtE
MLNLTASERQGLIGPLVVGCLLGALLALATWGFDSEYSHIDHWHMALDASFAFLAALAIAALPLGVLPIAIGRLNRRHRSASDEAD